ncbi:hypothetical protein E9529_09870 [Blastococcus sp. KM273128]|uniref:DUF6752 domain-containing protein n=1 Tax=Blastococcus sp. KM273128 TaxID=2570314 RepID=UPI001F23ED70|nr:DUF6752 domain-containing protein [Blastococcus sp. KM273128]MCF6744582.1 hypothetical protein [Blastococcus sp. KM273128]
MTDQAGTTWDRGRRVVVQRLAYPLRRALAPAALELRGEVEALAAQSQGQRDGVTELHRELAETRTEVGSLRERVDELQRRLDAAEAYNVVLRDGLEESRRLNLRVAELVDVVTELVIPLHDREIDPAALGRLRPDTL